MGRGTFFTFEGIDGSGKSTAIRYLAQELKSQGHEVSLFREPGGTDVGERVRELLLQDGPKPLELRAEVLLFAAARAQLVEQCIKPALARGEIVLCDRFRDSTLAYQGYGRGLDVAWLQGLNDYACDNCEITRTFFLDVEIPTAQARIQERKDSSNRLDQEAESFMLRVQQGYRHLAEASAQKSGRRAARIQVIDANRPVEEVVAQIKQLIEEALA